jgi:hypothetical protein
MFIMENWLIKYKPYIQNKKFVVSLIISFLFLIGSIIISYFAIVYATKSSSGPVTDIILNNIPVFDVDHIFVFGPFAFWIIIAIYLFFNPQKFPFALKGIATFTLIRSFFLIMTHIGPFPTHLQIGGTGISGVFTSGNDLFFSGHTGLPFMMALTFWDKKFLRLFCLISSLFFGAVVLMAHLHYTIDVFAAFFITYTIFHITRVLFKKDHQIFMNGLNIDS